MAQRAASSAQGRLNRRFLLVAILLAGLSAALVYARIAATGEDSGGGGGGGGDQQVVVARIPIQERTTITEEMLEIKSVSGSAVAAGAFTTVDDVVGKVTKFPVEVNQQVLSSGVIDTSRPVSDAALSLVVPTERRAFSIGANQVLTAGGLLLPGDYVDIVWVCCKNGLQWQGRAPGETVNTQAVILSRPVVQNVQVAAVAQQIVPSGPVGTGDATDPESAGTGNPVAADTPNQIPDATTITLLVTPEQAGILLMAEQTGVLRAALRNPGDTATTPAPNDTQFVTPHLLPEDLIRFIQDTFTQTN